MKLGNPNDMHKYEDMLNLPHPVSLRHAHMAISDRAAQFAPFAALTGHSVAIQKAAQTAFEKMEEFKGDDIMAPEIDKSTREERENYINGKQSFLEISKKYR